MNRCGNADKIRIFLSTKWKCPGVYTVYNKVLRQQSTIDLWGRRIEMVEKPQKFLVLWGLKRSK
ncbi:hypothetical protein DXB05_09405 [Clostridium sp. OF13-4]|nr:hypothetical protein DXB05_09405 [Clostridium sp. OF13-4]